MLIQIYSDFRLCQKCHTNIFGYSFLSFSWHKYFRIFVRIKIHTNVTLWRKSLLYFFGGTSVSRFFFPGRPLPPFSGSAFSRLLQPVRLIDNPPTSRWLFVCFHRVWFLLIIPDHAIVLDKMIILPPSREATNLQRDHLLAIITHLQQPDHPDHLDHPDHPDHPDHLDQPDHSTTSINKYHIFCL